jgi:hypothetical protein
MLYHVAQRDNLEDFHHLVNRLCQGGWQPQGGVQVFHACRDGESRTRLWYGQAMVHPDTTAGLDIANEVEDWLREQP